MKMFVVTTLVGHRRQPIQDVGYHQPPAEAVTTNGAIYKGDKFHELFCLWLQYVY